MTITRFNGLRGIPARALLRVGRSGLGPFFPDLFQVPLFPEVTQDNLSGPALDPNPHTRRQHPVHNGPDLPPSVSTSISAPKCGVALICLEHALVFLSEHSPFAVSGFSANAVLADVVEFFWNGVAETHGCGGVEREVLASDIVEGLVFHVEVADLGDFEEGFRGFFFGEWSGEWVCLG